MSYSKFKRDKDEFQKIFSTNSDVTLVRSFENSDLNVILSAETFVSAIKPILEKMLDDKLDDKRVVLIPNAGIGTDKMEMSYQYLVEFTTINNMYLKQLDIERWPKEVILEAIHSCDIISFSGGLVSKLIQAIDTIGIRDELIAVINSGKPLFCFSAGSMIMSNSTQFAANFMGEPDPETKDLKPLGIVDFEVYPHFENTMLSSVKEMSKGLTEAYAIKADEALIITEGQLYQIGNPVKIV